MEVEMLVVLGDIGDGERCVERIEVPVPFEVVGPAGHSEGVCGDG